MAHRPYLLLNHSKFEKIFREWQQHTKYPGFHAIVFIKEMQKPIAYLFLSHLRVREKLGESYLFRWRGKCSLFSSYQVRGSRLRSSIILGSEERKLRFGVQLSIFLARPTLSS